MAERRESAALIAAGCEGLPYSTDFAPPSASAAFYCSSLVEWAYQQASGRPDALFPGRTTPFKLLFEPRGYWRQYYAKMGVVLPRNATGSNPTELLHSPMLRFTAYEKTATGVVRAHAPSSSSRFT